MSNLPLIHSMIALSARSAVDQIKKARINSVDYRELEFWLKQLAYHLDSGERMIARGRSAASAGAEAMDYDRHP